MIVSNTDCELKGEEKEVLRAFHNINDDGVTSVDKGETTSDKISNFLCQKEDK